jgi:hypothetical protein
MRRLSLLLLLLVPLAAGCGSEPSSLQGSDDALKDASSSRVELNLEGKGMPDWGLMRSTGSIDYANSRGELLFTGKSDSTPEARALFVGGDSYLGAKVGDTMYWVKESGESTRAADRFMPGATGMRPDRLLKDLIKASNKVEKLGSEEIRGVTTTHYRAHLDKSKLGIDGKQNEPGVVEAWIDEQGLPRRVRVPYGGENGPVAVADLFDFGVSVDVEAPPADDILTEEAFSKLMDKECAKVKAAKDLEDANPLCLLFGTTLEPSGSDSMQISPTETVPTTEGK